jgi:hypothetical protein
MLLFGCSITYSDKTNDSGIHELGNQYNLQVHNLSEIPSELLKNLDKMGTDNSAILNQYEGRFFNFIFKVDTNCIDLVGKKVYFFGSKIDYFKDTRSPDRNFTTVGGSSLYFFDSTTIKSIGYDAAITYWDKFVIPIEKVVEQLQKNN